MNKYTCLVFTFIILISTANADDLVFKKSKIIPLENIEGKTILESYILFESPIEIVESGFIDLFGDNKFTEFYAVYSQYDGKSVRVALASSRRNRKQQECVFFSGKSSIMIIFILCQ
ncbi:hypothetical protein FACS1894164_17180 [Spirochaetia bacterium]|nr:hypothetical protein FACS1894164_17180 [Spirochaetia bacterium]